jgi:hypothetical protein
MDKTFNPEKCKLMFCPLCKGSGKLKGLMVLTFAKDVAGFGLLKKKRELLKRIKMNRK